MNPFRKTCVLAAGFAVVWSIAAEPVRAAIVYSSGHADIGVLFESGELELHYHFDTSTNKEALGGGEVPLVPPGTTDPEAFEFSPDGIFVRIPDPPVERPAGSEWDFTGASSGGDLWLASQVNEIGKPFLGLASEDLTISDWAGQISWALTAVTAPLGGEFALWQTGIFGDPTRRWDTQDGSFFNDEFELSVGGHNHFNWGFTAPGVYELELTATGTHNTFGTVSDTETFTFLVGDSTQVPAAVPEPGSMLLLCLGGAGMIGGRLWRRRKTGAAIH